MRRRDSQSQLHSVLAREVVLAVEDFDVQLKDKGIGVLLLFTSYQRPKDEIV